jgi:hypothetical protein
MLVSVLGWGFRESELLFLVHGWCGLRFRHRIPAVSHRLPLSPLISSLPSEAVGHFVPVNSPSHPGFPSFVSAFCPLLPAVVLVCEELKRAERHAAHGRSSVSGRTVRANLNCYRTVYSRFGTVFSTSRCIACPCGHRVGWVRLQRSGWPQMMNRTNFSKIAIVLLALCFLESGCSLESGKATQSKPTRWNITQIEAKIKNWAKLKEIQLTDKQNGKYEGTGTGEDGLTYEITAAYAYSESEDNVEYEFHFDAEDTNGIVTSGTEQRDGTSMSMETKIGPKLK